MLNRFLYFFLLLSASLSAQSFYRGADLSYVNEMEDCGVVYKKDGKAIDPYGLFADEGCQLVRLRLWHNPSWYAGINKGKIYSNTQDVTKSIRRAKQHGMKVLLDFHLSDNWADPSKQLVPAAWAPVVNNTPVLKDSVYNYIYKTLMDLDALDLLPDMVQVGNETNRGIVLSAEDNAKFTLEWPRNAILFNAGLKAVRDAAQHSQKEIVSIIHLADPGEAAWLAEAFTKNGITDYDVIGLSYYWAWHKPKTIQDAAQSIKTLKQKYNKDIIILETGYIWTLASNDQANNIINEVNANYAPPSPNAQYRWLKDLSTAVQQAGGMGVLYWEPAWVSSSCSTQWGKGSHQENATFFDFSTNAQMDGGFRWLREGKATNTQEIAPELVMQFDSITKSIRFSQRTSGLLTIHSVDGKILDSINFKGEESVPIPAFLHGLCIISVQTGDSPTQKKSITVYLP